MDYIYIYIYIYIGRDCFNSPLLHYPSVECRARDEHELVFKPTLGAAERKMLCL